VGIAVVTDYGFVGIGRHLLVGERRESFACRNSVVSVAVGGGWEGRVRAVVLARAFVRK
jgi:hypothetical protein